MAVSPTLPKDRFTAADEAPTTLAHHAPSNTPDAQTSRAFAATLGPPDPSVQIPRDQRSRGKRATLARVAIAICLGASAIGGWRLYGGAASEMIAPWARPFGWTLVQTAADQRPAPRTVDPTPEQAAAPPEPQTSAPPPAQAA